LTDLEEALDAVIEHTAIVSEIRSDLVLRRLVKSYQKAGFAKFDEDEIGDELRDLSDRVAFDTSAFPIDAIEGIKAAASARMDLQAARDRLVSLSRKLREGISKSSRVLRVGLVYIRQRDDIKRVPTAKHKDDVANVSLREIVESYESMKLLLDEVKETLSAIDDKSKVLDAWFLLHKQYVFMSGDRGPRGEQDTNDEARRQLGKKRQRSLD